MSPLIWYQREGELWTPSKYQASGYSGAGEHKNDPDSAHLANLGPIPCGVYWLGEPRDTPNHGPFVIPLVPVAGTELFNRSAFLVHGDSIKAPGTASEGCIILDKTTRLWIHESNAKFLVVLRERWF